MLGTVRTVAFDARGNRDEGLNGETWTDHPTTTPAAPGVGLAL